MYQAPPPLASNQAAAKRLPWRGCGFGVLFGFLLAALYGLAVVLLFLAFDGYEDLETVGGAVLFGLGYGLLIGGVPSGFLGAFTGWITGLLLARQHHPVDNATAVRTALSVSAILALLVNIVFMLFFGVTFQSPDDLLIYAIFMLIPTLIYLAASAWISVRLNRWWHQQ